MGLDDLSHDSLRVLKKNFPNSSYLSELQGKEESETSKDNE
jgi:outer membrane protein assembly factor BamD (BamD/ComL family)